MKMVRIREFLVEIVFEQNEIVRLCPADKIYFL